MHYFQIAGAGIKAIKAGRKAQKDMEGLMTGDDDSDLDLKDSNSKKSAPPVGASTSPDSIPSVDEEDSAKPGQMTDEEKATMAADKLSESMPVILNLAWAINTRDITKTLKQVCKKLFRT